MKPEKHFCATCERLIPIQHTYCVTCKAANEKKDKELHDYIANALEPNRCSMCAQLVGTYRACSTCPDKQDERAQAVFQKADDIAHGKWTPHGIRDDEPRAQAGMSLAEHKKTYPHLYPQAVE